MTTLATPKTLWSTISPDSLDVQAASGLFAGLREWNEHAHVNGAVNFLTLRTIEPRDNVIRQEGIGSANVCAGAEAGYMDSCCQ